MKTGRPLSLIAPLAAWFCAQSCITDNQAAYEGILGPARGEASATGGGTGGSNTGGTGALPTGGSPSSGAGGSLAGESGMGEGGQGATGGSTGGTSGGSGTAGTTVNPPPHPDFMPPCFLTTTQSGEEILKGTPCTSADPPLCYRPCGPSQVGWKTEECLAGVYAEGDCGFPVEADYACFKIPDVIDEGACGITAPPAATDPCNAESCTVCNFGGHYEDSGGEAKLGYCVCRDADELGVRRWTCASETAWPCPVNRGCF